MSPVVPHQTLPIALEPDVALARDVRVLPDLVYAVADGWEHP